MNDVYQMTITGPGDGEDIVRKGSMQEIFGQEKELVEEYTKQGFTIRKHTVGFSGRHPTRGVEVSCEIRKVAS